MQTNFEWQSPEYEWTSRGNDWYWAVGTVAVVAIGLAVFFKNYLLAILMLVAGTLLVGY